MADPDTSSTKNTKVIISVKERVVPFNLNITVIGRKIYYIYPNLFYNLLKLIQ